MVADTTLYEILQVSPSASDTQIKKNYRKLAKEYHPDKNQSPENEEKFKELTFAYEVLTNPEKKALYDRFGLDAVRDGGSSSGAGAGFEDVFGHFFGGGGGGGGGHPFDDMFSPFGFGGMGGMGGHSRRQRRGKDVLHPLKVSLEDLYKGKTSKIQLNKTVICKKCNGQGGKSGSSINCQDCKGRGIVIKIRQLGPGMMQQMQQECSTCAGQGTTIAEKDKCKSCSGRKVVKETKILEVNVERGAQNEQKIRFSGEGDQQPGIEPGDVIIVLSEQPHETFSRRGDHLIYKLRITLNEALCGFKRVMKHLDGRDIVLSSTPGMVVKPASLFVVEGEGMPKPRDPTSNGDLYVSCDIDFPDSISDVAGLEAALPKRPQLKLPDDCEEVDMIDFDAQANNGDHQRSSQQAYAESDSDDEAGGGGPRVQQCTTG